jgi:(R,R)-butanediol dehydrogenase/meso-butanediol dehydrogenase/diacetyl reductase
MTLASMSAAVFGGPGKLEIAKRPIPRIAQPDDVLIRIEACGVCGSDLQILAVPPGHPAKLGVILGHEISGRVVDQGPAASCAPGMVVVDPDIKCGVCEFCRRGHPAICQAMVSMGVDADGGFASYCVVPARSVYAISEAVPPAFAAMVEPLSNVLNGVRRVAPQVGETAAVIGSGPIGAMFLMALRVSGVSAAWVIEPVAARRELSIKIGASGAVANADLFLQAVERGEAPRPDIVVDAVGHCMVDALQIIASGGRVLLFGINHNAEATVHQSDLTMRQITVLGSVTSHFTIPDAIRVIEQGVLNMGELGIYQSSVEAAPETVTLLRSGQILKAVLCPQP